MSAGRSASFCLMVHFLLCSSEALENITAVVGQEVTLKCKVNNNNKPITVVEWSRTDLEEDYVLFYRGGKLMSDNQHPSYVNRVNLQDREMKDGDVSLILKDVKMEDRGTYECWVFQGETNRMKRSILSSDPINTIYLVVGPSGDKAGGDKDGGNKDGIIPGVVVLILLAVMAFVGFLIYRRHKRQNPNPHVPPDEPAAEQML